MGIMRPLSHIRYFKAYSASLLASLLHNQVSNGQWCGVHPDSFSVFCAVEYRSIQELWRALQELPSAHPAYEGIASAVELLSESETATSDSFCMSDEAPKGRYKKS